MKQYDKIYIPVNQMAQEGIYLIATEKTTTKPLVTVTSPLGYREWLEEHSDKIVITLEELREVYHANQLFTDTFEEYIKNKGINIQP